MRVFKIVHGDNRASETDALENGFTCYLINRYKFKLPFVRVLVGFRYLLLLFELDFRFLFIVL